MLLCPGQIDDETCTFLYYHPPEILFCMRQWSLRCYESRIISMNGTVNVIGVDVAVSDFGATLDKSNPGMLEWLQICVPVQIGLVEE